LTGLLEIAAESGAARVGAQRFQCGTIVAAAISALPGSPDRISMDFAGYFQPGPMKD